MAYPFPFFLVELRGERFRGLTLTLRFRNVLSEKERQQILEERPAFLGAAEIICEGRMLSVSVGKMVSQMSLEDAEEMLKWHQQSAGKNRIPYDYTYYLPERLERKTLDPLLVDWLDKIDQITPVEFAIRDEGDLSTSQYPGASWLLISESMLAWHETSEAGGVAMLLDLADREDSYHAADDERKMFAYAIKCVSACHRLRGFAIPSRLKEFVADYGFVYDLLKSTDLDGLSDLVRLNEEGAYRDVSLYVQMGKILNHEESLEDPTVEPEVWTAVFRMLLPVPNALEYMLHGAYGLSVIAEKALYAAQPDVLSLMLTYVEEKKVWNDGFVYRVGELAQYYLRLNRFADALTLFRMILPVKVRPVDDWLYPEMIVTYTSALWCVTERNSGLQVDDETIAEFIQICLPLASECAAIYAAVGLLWIQEKKFAPAVEAYDKMFDVPKLSWPRRNVPVDASAYANALWVLIRENSSLELPPEMLRRFLEKCLPFADQNPPIYSNAVFIANQLGDIAQAAAYFALSRQKDPANTNVIESEIRTLPSCEILKKHLENAGLLAVK